MKTATFVRPPACQFGSPKARCEDLSVVLKVKGRCLVLTYVQGHKHDPSRPSRAAERSLESSESEEFPVPLHDQSAKGSKEVSGQSRASVLKDVSSTAARTKTTMITPTHRPQASEQQRLLRSPKEHHEDESNLLKVNWFSFRVTDLPTSGGLLLQVLHVQLYTRLSTAFTTRYPWYQGL